MEDILHPRHGRISKVDGGRSTSTSWQDFSLDLKLPISARLVVGRPLEPSCLHLPQFWVTSLSHHVMLGLYLSADKPNSRPHAGVAITNHYAISSVHNLLYHGNCRHTLSSHTALFLREAKISFYWLQWVNPFLFHILLHHLWECPALTLASVKLVLWVPTNESPTSCLPLQTQKPFLASPFFQLWRQWLHNTFVLFVPSTY